jgi:hypothetical protein
VASTTVSETTVRTTSRSQTAELTVLHGWAGDPLDAWVVADSVVAGIDKNDLKVLVCSILVVANSSDNRENNSKNHATSKNAR